MSCIQQLPAFKQHMADPCRCFLFAPQNGHGWGQQLLSELPCHLIHCAPRWFLITGRCIWASLCITFTHVHYHICLDSADTKNRQQLLTRRLAELHATKRCEACLNGTIGLSRQWELEQSIQLLQSFRHISNCAGDYTRCIHNAALIELEPLLVDYAAQMTAAAQHVATRLLVAAKLGAKLAISSPIVSSLVDVVDNLIVSILDSSRSNDFLESTEMLNVFEAITDWQGRANSAFSTITELLMVTVHRIYAKVVAMKHLSYTDA